MDKPAPTDEGQHHPREGVAKGKMRLSDKLA